MRSQQEKRISKGIVEVSNDNNCAKMMLNSLDVEFPAIFLNVAKQCGYTVQLNAVISADYFMAMSEEANLRFSQQRVVNT